MKIFLYTLLVFIYLLQLVCSNAVANETYNFECEIRGKTDKKPGVAWCCGIAADGKRMCSLKDSWRKAGGKWSYCKGGPGDLSYEKQKGNKSSDEFVDLNNNNRPWDICCDDPLIDNCGTCGSFVVFPWPTQDELLNLQTAQKDLKNKDIFNKEWYEEDFLAQDDPVGSNKIYPAGFKHATLQEYNNPPVCVFVPNSAGKVIELKLEPDEKNSRLCISDLQDDMNSRNDPGQNTTCDDFRLLSCFADGGESDTARDKKKDFAFYVTCDEGCEEGGEVHFWYRARVSKRGWYNVDEDSDKQVAADNTEMWCQYILEKYPDFNVYPQDLVPDGYERMQPVLESGTLELFTIFPIIYGLFFC